MMVLTKHVHWELCAMVDFLQQHHNIHHPKNKERPGGHMGRSPGIFVLLSFNEIPLATNIYQFILWSTLSLYTASRDRIIDTLLFKFKNSSFHLL